MSGQQEPGGPPAVTVQAGLAAAVSAVQPEQGQPENEEVDQHGLV